MIKHCETCPGRCPENCENCIYYHCEKEVDYHLVRSKYHKYLNAMDTPYETEKELDFIRWFKAYFRINK